jgi:hypothetical protein
MLKFRISICVRVGLGAFFLHKLRDTHRDGGAKSQILARLFPAGAKTGSGFLLSQISPRICRRIFVIN